MIDLLIIIFGLCFLFSVVYPVSVILFYPVYRFLGGNMSFFKYMKDL